MKNHTVQACSGTADEAAAFRNKVRRAVAIIGGKWKLEILWLLNQRIHRFNELRRAIPGVTQHMLTAQLRELEADGLVRRTIYPEIPPRVEYEITSQARRLQPVFEAIFAWANEPSPATQTDPGRNRKVRSGRDRARAADSKPATP
jgi:DNA-binding HxlR family transcriptional regulator